MIFPAWPNLPASCGAPGSSTRESAPGSFVEHLTALAKRWFSVPHARIEISGQCLCELAGHPEPPSIGTSESDGARIFAVSELTDRSGRLLGWLTLADHPERRVTASESSQLRELAALAGVVLEGWLAPARAGRGTTLESAEGRYRALFENSLDLVYAHDLAGRITAVNRAAERLSGYSREELLSMTVSDLVSPEDGETVRQMILEQYGGGASQVYELTLAAKDGARRRVEVTGHLLFEAGRPAGLMGFGRDVTSRCQEREARRRAEDGLRDATEKLAQLNLRWQQFHRLVAAGSSSVESLLPVYLKSGCEMLGVETGLLMEVGGSRCRVRAFHSGGGEPAPEGDFPLDETFLAQAAAGGGPREDCRSAPSGAKPIVCRDAAGYLVCAPVLSGPRAENVLCFASRRPLPAPPPNAVQVVELLAAMLGNVLLAGELYASQYDRLTGLYNGQSVVERLERMLSEEPGGKGGVTVAVMDVDLLRQFNERFGYAAGDSVLRAIAGRLKGCLRDQDLLGRMGADRFIAVFPGAGSSDAAVELGSRMLESVREPFLVGEHPVSVTLSMGLSLHPRDGRDASSLIRHADAALVRAKHSGRNVLRIGSRRDTDGRPPRPALEQRLFTALGNQELLLRFQPEIGGRGRLRAMEAFVAWRCPGWGLLPAGRFVPLAEENGLIVPIGAWVLEEACRCCAAWQRRGARPVKVAVNVSTLQFQRADFGETVLAALERHSLAPSLLEIEITESALMQDLERSARTMRRLRDRGVSFAIDDFGTGYSSLSYLSRLPADALKIDRSFLDSQGPPVPAHPILEAVAKLAHDLGLAVIAEGVETLEQWEIVRRAGCELVQGHLFGRPVHTRTAIRLARAGRLALPRTLRSRLSRRS